MSAVSFPEDMSKCVICKDPEGKMFGGTCTFCFDDIVKKLFAKERLRT